MHVYPKRKEISMRKVIFIIGVFVCVFALQPWATAAEIKVGTLLSHTGPLKEFGPAIQNGAVLADKQLGAAGFEIEMIHEDSETSAIPATNAAKKLVEINRVVAIIGPNAAPIKRLRDEARDDKRLIDATQGRKTRSVIITDSNHVILSAIQSETIAQRFSPDCTLTKGDIEE